MLIQLRLVLLLTVLASSVSFTQRPIYFYYSNFEIFCQMLEELFFVFLLNSIAFPFQEM